MFFQNVVTYLTFFFFLRKTRNIKKPMAHFQGKVESNAVTRKPANLYLNFDNQNYF